jgi:hypothetical protein
VSGVLVIGSGHGWFLSARRGYLFMDRQHGPFDVPIVGMVDDRRTPGPTHHPDLGNREDDVSVNHLPQELP